ncbi:erythromycin esterase family protein [Singulisphaera sp. Ch08]|uniref:Erythromycin esterase family protein n=1 Tax=Singulisphaera sp. Ch08 TaxID=3120278 RepID=A0AAU7CBS3_9BACT
MRTTTPQDVADDLVICALRGAIHPLIGAAEDYNPLLDLVGDAHFVLLGEASHGTHEFYRERAQITKRLIREKGFTAVAVEADWPDAYRVNRYVRGSGDDPDVVETLAGFRRFPAWMWRNADVLDFVGWLRAHNDELGQERSKVGFYGLDLYSLHASIEAVLLYLDKVDSDAAERARARYACFDRYGEDTQAYGFASGLGLGPSCEHEVILQLVDLRRAAAEYVLRDGRIAEDDYFYAEQNARLVRDAEQYYRTMYRGEVSSWNLRDRHMAETLDALVEYLGQRGDLPKVVVWAHNSHLGDARATQMGVRGEWNVGQLVRERHDRDAVSVGFTTYDGTVTASSNWDAPAERMWVRPALAGSYERLFHDVGPGRFFLGLRDDDRTAGLHEPRLERAIGVIYRPETERASHYFRAHLPAQFDAILHFDRTRAVEPLERTPEWERGEVPETFPTGL